MVRFRVMLLLSMRVGIPSKCRSTRVVIEELSVSLSPLSGEIKTLTEGRMLDITLLRQFPPGADCIDDVGFDVVVKQTISVISKGHGRMRNGDESISSTVLPAHLRFPGSYLLQSRILMLERRTGEVRAH